MTPADLARRLFRDQCGHNDLSSYGERAAIAAMVPLIEALKLMVMFAPDAATDQFLSAVAAARAALTPRPEEVA